MKVSQLLLLAFRILTVTLAQTINVDLVKPATTPFPVTPFFTGMAIEYQGIFRLFGKPNSNLVNYGVDATNLTSVPSTMLNMKSIKLFQTLIKAISTKAESTPTTFILRVGGNSANKMWYE